VNPGFRDYHKDQLIKIIDSIRRSYFLKFMNIQDKDMVSDKYTISELAAEFDISPSTIRFYEEKGLLVPERSQGNQRVYSQKHRGRLKLILISVRLNRSIKVFFT
jgi:hypothetical protein